jgi:hypothetical protein
MSIEYRRATAQMKRPQRARLPALLPLALLASCTTGGGGGFADGGKAPPGYEVFACLPTGFPFLPGSAELVEIGDDGRAAFYKATRGQDEWVMLTVAGKSPSGAPIGKALIDRRARSVLDWLARQGRRRDRVEVRVNAEERAFSIDAPAGGRRVKVEFGADVTAMLPHEQAERRRKALEALPPIPSSPAGNGVVRALDSDRPRCPTE